MEQGGNRREWETDLDFRWASFKKCLKKKKKKTASKCVLRGGGGLGTHEVVMFWLGLALASPSCLRSV